MELHDVDHITWEDVRDANGRRTGRRTVIHDGNGDGRQDNVQAPMDGNTHGKVMCVTSGENAIAAIDRVRLNSGCNKVYILAYPDFRDDSPEQAPPEQVGAKRVRLSDDSQTIDDAGHSAAKRVRRGGAFTGVSCTGEENNVPSGLDEAVKRCGACGKSSHELDSCVRPSRDGTLRGCPMCNSAGHDVDQCARWSLMTIEEKFMVLVVGRGRMVPLCTATDQLWYQIFEEHLRSGSGLTMPTSFPLTREFGLAYRDDEEELASWEAFYETHDRNVLPLDLKTRDVNAVRRFFAGAAYQ
ncbi:hypothetical protein PLICBS_010005 [Purpureocillium lilacinum]|nr:hypothetical protein PLICBS_010005 [Purpureocillium lilacinum]